MGYWMKETTTIHDQITYSPYRIASTAPLSVEPTKIMFIPSQFPGMTNDEILELCGKIMGEGKGI